MKLLCRIIFIFSFIGLCSCSAFYTRHYTKGYYHEGFAKNKYTNQVPATSGIKGFHNPFTKDTLEGKRDTELKNIAQQNTTPATLTKQRHFKDGKKKLLLLNHRPIKETVAFSKTALQKTLRTVVPSGNSAEGKALLYILTIVLALAIIALAIYFLPAILIPAPVSSAFITLIIIAAIVVLVILALIIYSLFLHLIHLFKPKKADPEDDF